jgi:hypothetical protein
MNKEELIREQEVLRNMRKTLGNIVRDCTPLGGRPNPLKEATIQDIKDCFTLISDRERELGEKLGFDQSKPYFKDGEQPNSNVVSFVKPS